MAEVIKRAGAACTVEGIALVGPALIAELTQAIEYATGLGIGMSDLPFEAIEWYNGMNEINTD